MNGVCVCGLEYGSLSLSGLVLSGLVSLCLCLSLCFCVFLCVNLCHIHIVRMQCCARCMFFGIHMALSLHPHQRQF